MLLVALWDKKNGRLHQAVDNHVGVGKNRSKFTSVKVKYSKKKVTFNLKDIKTLFGQENKVNMLLKHEIIVAEMCSYFERYKVPNSATSQALLQNYALQKKDH